MNIINYFRFPYKKLKRLGNKHSNHNKRPPKAIIYCRHFRLFIAALTVLCLTECGPPQPTHTEILWDTWGVPHIYAKDVTSLFFAFGWAQTASHGDRLLRLYGQGRARAAEYWGEEYLDADRYLRIWRVPERTQVWYESQSEDFRGYLDAFASGINAYAREHADQIADDVEVILPVSGVDVIANMQRAIHFTYLTGSSSATWAQKYITSGSSAWAVGPSRSASGHAMLVANPHLQWNGWGGLLYEAHLVAPGIDMYGTAFIGFPVLVIAFNQHLGWTHTLNATDPGDFYELTLTEGGYRFDDEVRPFDENLDTLRVLDADGALRTEELHSLWSVHGPVLAKKGDRAIANRIIGLEAPQMLEQWWNMGRATNLETFETALRRQQIPLFTVTYADRDGHIMHYFGGHTPVKSEGDYSSWQGVQRGDISRTLWTEIHPYDNLPRIVDPPSGWLQNANEPPWTVTIPNTLNPEDYPPYMTMSSTYWPRAMRSARTLAENERITFEDLIEYKHSTHVELASRIADDLITAARELGGPLAKRAADVLERWDQETNSDSRGAVLFILWGQEIAATMGEFQALFSIPWNPETPFTTPDGLKDPAKSVKALEQAANKVETNYGTLDVSWGDVFRIRVNGLDLPANGAGDPWGISRATFYQPAGDGLFDAVGGDTYVAVVEFADPIRARTLLTYGNSSQPHSLHKGDQFELYARKELREVWLTRRDVEANLELRETLNRLSEKR